jgi:hypothetical protein
MPEVSLVHLDAAECFALKATALRIHPKGAWHVFVTTGDSPYWLAVFETEKIPRLVCDDETAAYWAKAALLLGEPWTDCYENTADTLAFQYAALDEIGPNVRARLQDSTPEDIAQWREEMERQHDGAYLWSMFTGTDPRAAAN